MTKRGSSRKRVEQVNHFAWKSISLVAKVRAHVNYSGSQFAFFALLCLVRFKDFGGRSEPRMDPSLIRSCRCIAERGRTGAQND